MIWRPTLEELREYKDSKALNSHYLTDVVMKGKSLGYTGNSSTIGDLVDIYLTLPDLVSEIFTVFTGTAPSEKVIDFLTDAMVYLAERKSLTAVMKDHEEVILKQAGFAGFDQKKKPEVLFANLLAKAQDWWRFTVEAIGKTVVLERDRSFAAEIEKATKRHDATSVYFPDYEIPGRDLYYQKPIYFEIPVDDFKCVECKALPDLVIVSHTKRKIIHKEIKTVFDCTNEIILEQLKKYSYVDQVSFYEEALRSEYATLIAAGYEIESEILFISKNLNAFRPVFVPMTKDMLDWSKYGGAIEGRHYNFDNHTMRTLKDVKGWLHYVKVYKKTMSTATANTFNDQFQTNYISPAEVQAAYFN